MSWCHNVIMSWCHDELVTYKRWKKFVLNIWLFFTYWQARVQIPSPKEVPGLSKILCFQTVFIHNYFEGIKIVICLSGNLIHIKAWWFLGMAQVCAVRQTSVFVGSELEFPHHQLSSMSVTSFLIRCLSSLFKLNNRWRLKQFYLQ